jgi:glycosyltransferase involved in cell wall biosynthesis
MVSVIIPTKDRLTLLSQCLNGLYCQTATASAFDVIVVNDGATIGGLKEMLEKHPLTRRTTLRLLDNAQNGPAIARNRGSQLVNREIIAFLDDDAVPDHAWIDTIIKALPPERTEVAAITGRILPLQTGLFSDARQARYDLRQQSMVDSGHLQTEFLAGGNSAVRTEVFHSLNGFDPRCTMMHDREFMLRMKRLNKLAMYCHEMVIHHVHVKSVPDAFTNAFTSGRFRYMMGNEYASEKTSLMKEIRTARKHLSTRYPGYGKSVNAVNSFLHCFHMLGYLTARQRHDVWPKVKVADSCTEVRLNA